MQRLHKLIIRLLSLLLLTSMLIACSTTDPLNNENSNLVWPPAPAKAKVRFVRTFSKPDDLGIGRGFFQWVSDFFTGEVNYRLIRPMSVVITNRQQIYVADPGAKGVHRFDLKEQEYKLITRKDGLGLPSPVALCLGPDDSVFVVDSELAQVFHIAPTADHAKKILPSLKLLQPTGIVYDHKNKRLYLSDTAKHQVKIISQNGRSVRYFGRRGSRAGEFNFPTYLWLDNRNRLLVTDSLNFRIQLFDSNGKYISEFGRLGDASGNLSRPKGIAADKEGHIFVVDALFNAIQIFNDKGTLMLPVGSQGSELGQFWLPAGIFLTNNGEIYIADSHNQRVQVLRYVGGR